MKRGLLDAGYKHATVVVFLILFLISVFPVNREQFAIDYYEQRFPNYSALVSEEMDDMPIILPVPSLGKNQYLKTAGQRLGIYEPASPENITLVLQNVSYRIQSGDYAIINGIEFAVLSNVSSVKVNVLVYIWDENDPEENRQFVWRVVPYVTKKYGMTLNDTFVPVYIPVNDINLNKTLKLVVTAYTPAGTKWFGSLEYTFRMNESLPLE